MLFKKIFLSFVLTVLLLLSSCSIPNDEIVNVPFILDHNRMLVKGEIQKKDGTYRSVILWVDTGNPDCFISPELAADLGIFNCEDSSKAINGFIEADHQVKITVDGYSLDYSGIKTYINYDRFWLFKASGAEANLPSTVLMKYDVRFDYPERKFILAEKGKMKFDGGVIPAGINDSTGIVQVYGKCGNDSISFAVDIGASYTFGSTELFESILMNDSNLNYITGAVGCPNMWGWGRLENYSQLLRLPEIILGNQKLENIGITIPPDYNDKGFGMMDWYSQKTVKPVNGFLGPNAFMNFRLAIDYSYGKVYLEKVNNSDNNDLDMVAIAVRPEKNGSYTITSIASKGGRPLIDNIFAGDILTKVDNLSVKNSTMGTVIDALRGTPGETRNLLIERGGIIINIQAKVVRIL